MTPEALLVSTGVVALAEVGDKTQLLSLVLAARYATIPAIVAGTTLGMLIANIPAVLLGDRVLTLVPARIVRAFAAASFAVVGLLAFFGA